MRQCGAFGAEFAKVSGMNWITADIGDFFTVALDNNAAAGTAVAAGGFGFHAELIAQLNH